MPPVMDLRGPIESFADVYTLTPGGIPTWSHGVATPHTGTAVQIEAMIAPLTDQQELQRMPAGTRLDDVFEAFTTTEVLPGDETTGRAADVITVDGVDYQVQASAPWNHLGGFWRAVLRRKDP